MIPISVELAGSWSLVSYSSGTEALVSLIDGTEITALFAEDGLRGHSGCNRYMTSYETAGQSLHISPPAGTRMMCQLPDGLMAQEARFLELLSIAASYSIRDGRFLELFDGMGTRILQFTRA
jgi:heat shock protein HslJ